MKLIFNLFFLFILLTYQYSYPQSGWNLADGPTRKLLNSVCIINENLIYISGDSLIDNIQNPNTSFFLVSTNGGSSWQRSNNFPGGSLIIFKAHSPTTIFSATWQRTGQNSAYSYLNYMDIGGSSFVISYSAFGTYEYISRFNFIEPNIIYASSPARILKRIGNGGYVTIPSNIIQSNTLCFINSNTGYVTKSAILLKTTNSGNSWDTVTNSGASKLYFYDEYSGYRISSSGNAIHKTTDGGINWDISDQGSFIDFYFLNIDTGYSCGFNGRIKRTADGGANWVNQITPITSKLNSICFYNSSFGVAVGDSGKILITSSGGVGIHKINNTFPNEFYLSQNYPNPFNPNSKIKFQIPKSTIVKLVVYDVPGKEIQKLIYENLSPGTYEVSFDGSNLPSGIYYYRLAAGDYFETKKMVLIK